MNVMMLLEMAATTFEDRVAIKNGKETLTYGELFAAAGAAAEKIKASDARRLAVLDVSTLAIPIGLFAAGCAGVPFVPLNYRLTKEEVEKLIARITPAYLITDAARTDELAKLDGTQVIATGDFVKAAREGKAETSWPMDPEDVAVLLFTSGTTGAPKAAVLRQKHLVSYILGSVEFAGAGEDDSTLVCVPPYHVAGMAAILSSVYAGRRIIQLANFKADEWIRLVREEKVTNAFVVPTMLTRVIEALEGEDSANMPSLRAISYGGGKMPLSVITKAMKLFPETDFTNAYGLTETSSTIAVLGPDDHREAASSDDPKIQRRLVSVGRPLPPLELEIRDDEGKVLGAGQRGEIYVRGEQVSGEYEGKGSLLDKEGWFPTRDAGSIDEGGYLFIEGRADDVIVRGGENMSPGEIEDVMLEHEAVADAAVVGIPDEQWGEAVAAAVVLKEGQSVSVEALQAFVKEHLRSSRVPQVIKFNKELPYNETGKLLRRVVKAELSGKA